jgi:hypothetical protein
MPIFVLSLTMNSRWPSKGKDVFKGVRGILIFVEAPPHCALTSATVALSSSGWCRFEIGRTAAKHPSYSGAPVNVHDTKMTSSGIIVLPQTLMFTALM